MDPLKATDLQARADMIASIIDRGGKIQESAPLELALYEAAAAIVAGLDRIRASLNEIDNSIGARE